MAKQINILIQAYKYLEWLRRYTDPLSGRRLPAPSAAYENPVHRLFSLSGKTWNHGSDACFERVLSRPLL